MKIQIFSHLKEVHNLGISVCRFAVGGIFPITFMGRINLSANPKLFAEHKNRFNGCWQYCILLKIVVIYFTYRNMGLLDFHYYLDSGRVIANYKANIAIPSALCHCHRIMPWVKDGAEKLKILNETNWKCCFFSSLLASQRSCRFHFSCLPINLILRCLFLNYLAWLAATVQNKQKTRWII